MSDIRFGVLMEPTNDAGPHKIGRVLLDGKVFAMQIMETGGVEGVDIGGARVEVRVPNGDMGQAVATVMPPPSQRTDQQQAGERMYMNYVTGNFMQHKADGSTELNTAGNTDVNTGGTATMEAQKEFIIRAPMVRINP